MLKYITIRPRLLPISLHLYLPSLAIFILLCLASTALFVLSVGSGEMVIDPVDAGLALIGQGDPVHEMVIFTLRLPRALTALMVGAAFAVSGAILQGVMRNPLAAPDIIGITGGASVGAVFLLTFFTANAATWLPFTAFMSGCLTALLIYLFAWKQGVSPLRLILIGVGINGAAHGVTTLLLLISPLYTANRAMVWLTGSVYGSSWDSIKTLLPWLLLFLPLALLLHRQLNVQQMGDHVAHGLGHHVQRNRLLLILVSVGLASSAVAFSGPIGFIGLMAPHIARMLTGPSYGSLLPIAAVIGSILVMSADLIGRTAFSPLDLPAGLFTAILGVPFLLVLLYRSGRIS